MKSGDELGNDDVAARKAEDGYDGTAAQRRWMGPYPFFGKPWPSGICDDPDAQQVPTPVGTLCGLCKKPIEVDHQGNFMGGENGPVPIHRECSLRSVMGGIGHHEDCKLWCQQRHDPDGGRTYRQSALEVWEKIMLGEIPLWGTPRAE